MSQRLFCKKKKGVSKKYFRISFLGKNWISKELSKKTGATQWCD
jgi:hypothetical protein